MNQPLDNHQPSSVCMDRLIDRLVDGELADSDRRALLLRLEAEPDGWRRCALAFLEAQSWRESFAPLAAPAPVPAHPAHPPIRRGRVPRLLLSVARLTPLAASLVLSFAIGWAWRGSPATPSLDEAVTPAPGPQPESNQIAMPEGPTTPASDRVAALVPVVKQWEQLGYQAETQTRLVSLKLRDGRRVDVPVREVRLRYVGDRTY